MYFTKPDTWLGGDYELALEIGERSDARLRNALQAVWSHPTLNGCYLDCEKEPHQQLRIAPPSELPEPMRLYGLAQLPNGHQVACRTYIIRFDDDDSDWLVFCLTMGALSEAYDVGGYPFVSDGEAIRPWLIPLNEWLRSIGQYVFSVVPFQLGLVGFDACGEVNARQVSEEGIPAKRYDGYLVPRNGELEWHAPNAWDMWVPAPGGTQHE